MQQKITFHFYFWINLKCDFSTDYMSRIIDGFFIIKING